MKPLRWFGRAAAFAVLLGLGGCYWRIAHEPMPFETFGDLGPERARGVIVLLPGFADKPDDYEVHGFLPALRRNAPGYDVVAADAHFGYYNKNTLIQQLHAGVIGPLVTRGYREIWLSGISMGGHGAVAYARAYPEGVKGVLLFAPYLGPSDVIAEVTQAGGICRYAASATPPQDRYEFARANFLWLKEALCTPPPKVAVWVGIGDRDQKGRELLRDAVAPGHYVVLSGGHDWTAWTPALETISQRVFNGSASLQ